MKLHLLLCLLGIHAWRPVAFNSSLFNRKPEDRIDPPMRIRQCGCCRERQEYDEHGVEGHFYWVIVPDPRDT